VKKPLTLACLLLLLSIFMLPALAEEEGEKTPPQESISRALPATQLLTLRLFEGGETHAFTMTVASRNFSMSLGEKNISLRGRLWEHGDGDRILDYTLEFTQWIDGQPGKQRSGSTWNGSTYIEDGKPVEIVRFLNGAFSLELKTLD